MLPLLSLSTLITYPNSCLLPLQCSPNQFPLRFSFPIHCCVYTHQIGFQSKSHLSCPPLELIELSGLKAVEFSMISNQFYCSFYKVTCL